MKRYIDDNGDMVVAADGQNPHDYWIPLPDGMTFEKREDGDNRRVFYIDVGNIPNFQAEEFMDKLKANLNRNKNHFAEVSTRWDHKTNEWQKAEGDAHSGGEDCGDAEAFDEACDDDLFAAKDCCDAEACGDVRFGAFTELYGRAPTVDDVFYDYMYATDEEAERILSRYKRWRLEELKLEAMAQNPFLSSGHTDRDESDEPRQC